MWIEFLALVAAVVGCSTAYRVWRQSRRLRRAEFVRTYRWPRGLLHKLGEKHPGLVRKDAALVSRGLRQFFIAHLMSGNKYVSMPSQIADDLWHEFILYTREYKEFCGRAFGDFLHHTPAAVLDPAQRASNEGLRRVWWYTCKYENIDPRNPTRLPLLFALDTKLNVPNGFRYDTDCQRLRDIGVAGVYCAGDFSSSGIDGGTGGFGDSSSGGGGGGGDGSLLGPAVISTNVVDGALHTPEALVANIEWSQRFSRRILFKTNFLRRRGTHEYTVNPDPESGALLLSSSGTSRYWELEATARYLGGERKDLTFSYVRSHATADLNNYDQFFGNLRNPIIRGNENNLTSSDVPHRFLVRGTIGLPGQWDFAPVLEIRSGFPYSAVDEFQDFVGPRNRAGRLPAVRTLDFSLSRPWQFKKYRFRAGLRMYNVFGSDSNRDIQNNITSPNFGRAFNPIERSIGFMFGSAK